MDSEDFELNTQNLNENYLEYYVETSFSTEEILGISSLSSSGLHEKNIIKAKKLIRYFLLRFDFN